MILSYFYKINAVGFSCIRLENSYVSTFLRLNPLCWLLINYQLIDIPIIF